MTPNLSPDASELLMCLGGPPQRATSICEQIGWSEDRFARALARLINCNPPQIEIFGSVDDQYLVRADDEDEEDEIQCR